MSNENSSATSSEPSNEPQYTEVELEAMEKGWVPKDQFDESSGKEWIPADEFLRNEKFYDEIHKLRRQLKQQKEALQNLTEHHAKVREVEYKRALEALKAEKAQALQDEDFEKVVEIDDKIDEVKEQARSAASAASSTENSVFDEWIKENSWYEEDKELQREADIVGAGYKMTNPQASLEEVYEYVTKRIKKMFPEKFGKSSNNSSSGKASPVEGDTRSIRKSKTKLSVSMLDEQQKQVMKTLIRAGAIKDEQQYLEELHAIGEI